MADAKNESGRGVEPPERLLPEDSILDLSEYLAMQRAIGDETRFHRVSSLGEAMLDHGVEELMRREEAFKEQHT